MLIESIYSLFYLYDVYRLTQLSVIHCITDYLLVTFGTFVGRVRKFAWFATVVWLVCSGAEYEFIGVIWCFVD